MNKMITFKNKLNQSLLLLVFALLALPCHAQQKPAERVKFRILTFSKVAGIDSLSFVAPKAKNPIEVKLHKNNFTGSYTSKTRNLVFYDSANQASQTKSVLGRVRIPSSLGKNVMLVAIAKGGKYHFIALKDNFSHFKHGEIKLINLTNKSVTASINSRRYKLLPLKTQHLKNLSTKKESHNLTAEFYLNFKGNQKLFSSGYWLYEPTVRKYAFIYVDPKTKRPRVKAIRDFSEPSPNKPSPH